MLRVVPLNKSFTNKQTEKKPCSKIFSYKYYQAMHQLQRLGLDIKEAKAIAGQNFRYNNYKIRITLEKPYLKEFIIQFQQKEILSLSRSPNIMILTTDSRRTLFEQWVSSKKNDNDGSISENELQEIARLLIDTRAFDEELIDTRPFDEEFIVSQLNFWFKSKQSEDITADTWSNIVTQINGLISKGFKQKALYGILVRQLQSDFVKQRLNPVFKDEDNDYDKFICGFLQSMNPVKTLILDMDNTLLPHRDDSPSSDIVDGQIPYYPWVKELINNLPELKRLGYEKFMGFTASHESKHKGTFEDFENQCKDKMKEIGLPKDTFQFEFYSRSETYNIYELKEGKRTITVTIKLSDKTKQIISYDRSATFNSNRTVNRAASTPTGITEVTTSSDGGTITTTTTSYEGSAKFKSDGTVNIAESTLIGITVATKLRSREITRRYDENVEITVGEDGSVTVEKGAIATETTVSTELGEKVSTTSYDGNVEIAVGKDRNVIVGEGATATRKTVTRKSSNGLRVTTETYDIISKKPRLIRKTLTISEKLKGSKMVQKKTYDTTSENQPILKDTTIEERLDDHEKETIKKYDIHLIKVVAAADGSAIVDDLPENISTLNQIRKIRSGFYVNGIFTLNPSIIDQILKPTDDKTDNKCGSSEENLISLVQTYSGSPSPESTPVSTMDDDSSNVVV